MTPQTQPESHRVEEDLVDESTRASADSTLKESAREGVAKRSRRTAVAHRFNGILKMRSKNR